LTDVFEALKVENSKDNRKTLDKAIRGILKMDESCPKYGKN